MLNELKHMFRKFLLQDYVMGGVFALLMFTIAARYMPFWMALISEIAVLCFAVAVEMIIRNRES